MHWWTLFRMKPQLHWWTLFRNKPQLNRWTRYCKSNVSAWDFGTFPYSHTHQAVVCLGIEPGFSTAGLSKYCQIFTDFVRLRLPFLMTYNEQQSCVIFFFDMWRFQGRDCKDVSLSYVTPCIVLQIYWRFWGTRCLHLRSRMSAMSLRNFGKFLPHQTVHNYMLPWSTKS